MIKIKYVQSNSYCQKSVNDPISNHFQYYLNDNQEFRIEKFEFNLKESLFFNFTDLKQLDLSKNKIKIIRNDSFNELKNLLILDLSSNLIETSETNTFKCLSLLTHLNISSNRLKNIDLNGLYSLKELDLKENELLTIANLIPTKTVELHVCIDDIENRLKESDLTNILDIIKTTLNINDEDDKNNNDS